ncbi:PP2C family protein-serine/threonine phosphatase [Butyrivibrio sp. WCD2001]|uniref:PP2C family protein-serine/threonine phosphatase n=1 Tax=Butyrivibrio sp. WCD2001 TaxID=1280681 RepID=UPI000414E653|nr:protein phosphatase 2C domain-containing protein [Butyrivibrio sp. WCD2001]
MFLKKNKSKLSSFMYSNPGGRQENEDTVGIFENEKNSLLVAVADGLGGHGGGKAASNAAIDSIHKDFLDEIINNPDEFRVWFQKANQKVLDMQTKECEMKTTLVTLVIDNEMAMWAHVGDSRLYHFINGKLEFRTFDHSVSQMAVLRGEISEDEIRGHVDRNKLLKALGRDERIDIEVSSLEDITFDEHAFLLCTDGFWEYVTEADMQKTLKHASSAEDWIKRMIKILNRNAKEDNDNNSAAAVIYRGE